MAKLVGTNINAQVVPNLDNDTYATHFEEFGKGGYRSVQTIADRDAITYERRAVGMEVRVLEGDGAGVYYLVSFEGDDFDGVTAQEWAPVTAQGGSVEKQVFSGVLEGNEFYETNDIEGSSPVLVAPMVGAIYLDIRTGITYHYDGDSYEKINTLSWTEVN